MSPHKSQDYKLSAVKYYLKSKNASEKTLKKYKE